MSEQKQKGITRENAEIRVQNRMERAPVRVSCLSDEIHLGICVKNAERDHGEADN